MSRLHSMYCDMIRAKYDASYFGKEVNIERTECVEEKLAKLGIGYRLYIETVLAIYDEFARSAGLKYPAWNMITGDKAIARVRDIIRYSHLESTDESIANDELYILFQLEVEWLTTYIHWYCGVDTARPPRKEYTFPNRLKSVVADYICDMFRIQHVSSNYNYIAKQVSRQVYGQS